MRLFVSLRPAPAAVADLSAALAGARTSRPDQWHVTLAFLGELASDRPLHQGLRTAAAAHESFTLSLQGSGSFGRSTWVGVGGEVAALRALQADVAAACRVAGVPLEERPHRPHLTVGRLPPAVLQSYQGPLWPVTEIELVRSVLGKGAAHSVLERFPLGRR
jgi:2'-5' RNA ligase